MKVFVGYDTKYGNTLNSAKEIAKGIGKHEGIEVEVGYVKEVNPRNLVSYDTFVLGAPNHMGRPSRTMKKFIGALAQIDLKATAAAVFGTYAGKVRDDRAVRKLERMAIEQLDLKLILPSLSVRVNGIPGPIVDGELERCLEFGENIGRQLIK